MTSGSPSSRLPDSHITISAPGKVILSGEHAVLYGHPAVSLAVGLYCHADIKMEHEIPGHLSVILEDLSSYELRIDDCQLMKPSEGLSKEALSMEALQMTKNSLESTDSNVSLIQSLQVIFYLLLRCLQLVKGHFSNRTTLCSPTTAVTVNIHSDIRLGAGLGSSAAFATTLATVFLYLLEVIQVEENISQKALIQTLAQEAETIIHGRSSGLDPTTSVQGGAIRFQLSSDGQPSFELLKCTMNLSIFIVDSQLQRSTSDVVRDLAQYRSKHPHIVDSIYARIGHIAAELVEMLRTDVVSLERIQKMISQNQKLLQEVGASCVILDNIIEELEQCGLATKLTGAGRGGCIIALIRNSDPSFIEKLNRATWSMKQRGLWTCVVPSFVSGVRFKRVDVFR